MCLALPAQIIEIDTSADTAVVSLENVRKTISLALVEGASVGDFVLVHVGYALSLIDQGEAVKTLELMAGIGDDPSKPSGTGGSNEIH